MRVPRQNNGSISRPVILIAIAAACLGGCSSIPSFSSSAPSSPSAPSTGIFSAPALVVQLQIDSVPQGAEARISLGPSCRTPCEIPLNNLLSDFTVTYTLNEFLPVTVPVKVTLVPSGFWTWGGAVVDPNPVVVQLQPVPPPPPPPRKRMKPRPPRPSTSAAPPFPAPPPQR